MMLEHVLLLIPCLPSVGAMGLQITSRLLQHEAPLLEHRRPLLVQDAVQLHGCCRAGAWMHVCTSALSNP